jgi:hypothetical protein
MNSKSSNVAAKYGFLVSGILTLEGCSRAPSVDVVGSFFPGWLVCLGMAIVLAGLVRLALLRLRLAFALPVLVYPSLSAIFTFVLWLIFYY